MHNQSPQERIDAFFKAPNGATFFEVGKHREALFAVKLPIGNNPRYSVVMANELYGERYAADGIYPTVDWELTVAGYADNETGKHLNCSGYSSFKRLFDYDSGITLSQAMHEVEDGVNSYLRSLSDEKLSMAALANGQDPASAMVLAGKELEKISEQCSRAYANGIELPGLNTDPLTDLSFNETNTLSNRARFSIEYLKDKEAFIKSIAEKKIPTIAIAILHHRAMEREAERCMQSLIAAPSQDLVNERSIRKAIEGKSSVWAIFANGPKTLRLSIPTSMFQSDSPKLNDWCLTNKDRKQLNQFLFDDRNRFLYSDILISHIIAMEYKNKTIFRDDNYYAQFYHLATVSVS